MDKTIKLDDREVRVRMSADTLRVYRKTFGRDLMKDMMSMTDEMNLEIIENLFYVCAQAADPELPPIDDWLAEFSTFALYKAANDLIAMWLDENKTTTQRKKKADR
jgi:hypothetical protein